MLNVVRGHILLQTAKDNLQIAQSANVEKNLPFYLMLLFKVLSQLQEKNNVITLLTCTLQLGHIAGDCKKSHVSIVSIWCKDFVWSIIEECFWCPLVARPLCKNSSERERIGRKESYNAAVTDHGFFVCQVFYTDIFNLLSYCLRRFLCDMLHLANTLCLVSSFKKSTLAHQNSLLFLPYHHPHWPNWISLFSKTGGAPLSKDPSFNSVSPVYTHNHTVGSKST